MEEVWSPIRNYEGYYEISNKGRVKSIKRIVETKNGKYSVKGKILSIGVDTKGYNHVILTKCGKSHARRIHQLIAQSFIPNPLHLLYVNHKNGIKTDNRVENLEWCTVRQNNLHALNNGLNFNFTETHGMSKLTNNDVIEIRKLIKYKIKLKDIAKIFNIHKNTISSIKTGRTWKRLKTI